MALNPPSWRKERFMFCRNRVSVMVGLVMAVVAAIGDSCRGEPKMKVNSTIAVVSHEFRRWTEGSFVAINDKDIFLALSGWTGPWNHDWSPANLYGFWSHDGGRTWTAQENAEMLQDAKSLGYRNVMSVDVLKLQNGDVLLTFFAHDEPTGDEEWAPPVGISLKRSKDNCKTWSKPEVIFKHLISLPDANFQLPSGRIVIPAYEDIPSGAPEKVRCCVLYSDDDAKSWTQSGFTQVKRSDGTGVYSCEPTIVLLKDGRLLMFIRSEIGQIYKSYSSDEGVTWTDALPTGILSPSSRSTLKRLPNGNLLLIFNMVRNEQEVFGESYSQDAIRPSAGGFPRGRFCTMISKDEGNTWQNLRFLDGSDDFGDIMKITMASTLFMGDDVLVAWSRSPRMSKKHYMNMFDYRYRIFNLDWLYAGDEKMTYKAPE